MYLSMCIYIYIYTYIYIYMYMFFLPRLTAAAPAGDR